MPYLDRLVIRYPDDDPEALAELWCELCDERVVELEPGLSFNRLDTWAQIHQKDGDHRLSDG